MAPPTRNITSHMAAEAWDSSWTFQSINTAPAVFPLTVNIISEISTTPFSPSWLPPSPTLFVVSHRLVIELVPYIAKTCGRCGSENFTPVAIICDHMTPTTRDPRGKRIVSSTRYIPDGKTRTCPEFAVSLRAWLIFILFDAGFFASFDTPHVKTFANPSGPRSLYCGFDRPAWLPCSLTISVGRTGSGVKGPSRSFPSSWSSVTRMPIAQVLCPPE